MINFLCNDIQQSRFQELFHPSHSCCGDGDNYGDARGSGTGSGFGARALLWYYPFHLILYI